MKGNSVPFIHIQSLPFSRPPNVPKIIEGVSKDFSKATGVGLEHVTATWQFFLPGHYAVAGVSAQQQPEQSHPLLVTLLAPDFQSQAQIEKSLMAVAASISKRAKVPLTNIFINHSQAHSGMVFDAGAIVRW